MSTQVQNKSELADVTAANEQQQAVYEQEMAAWTAAGSVGAEPVAPVALAAAVYTAEDVTAMETASTPWGDALLLPGSTKITASNGTVFGVTAADFAADWQPVA